MAIDWDQVAGLGGNDGAVADFVKKTRFEHGDIENAPTVHLVRLLDACRTQLNVRRCFFFFKLTSIGVKEQTVFETKRNGF